MALTGGEGKRRRHVILALAGPLLAMLFAAFIVSPAAARGAPDSFADLAARLSPAVVNISTSQVLDPGDMAIPGVPEDSPLNDFFDEFMEQQQGVRPQRVQSLGSGFVIDPKGIVITNNHVIEGADKIEVTFIDGTTLPATVKGSDPKTDLAVLEVVSDKPLPYVELGDRRASSRRSTAISMPAITTISFRRMPPSIAAIPAGRFSTCRAASSASIPRSSRPRALRSASVSPFRQAR